MGILLSKIRIQKFRSIDSMDIELGATNLLIGQNNTGKSNFLRAINIALGAMTDLSEADIFVSDGERLPKTKNAIIDIMLCPTDDDGKITKTFSEFWNSVFTVKWISTSVEGSFVGIRTEIKLDKDRDNYVITRKSITQWDDSIEKATTSKKETFNEDMREYISSFYMDANRDIVQDLRNKKSFFGRVTAGNDMSDEKVKEIEAQLSSVNAMIIENIPALQQTKEKIAAIGRTIGSTSSNVEIEPLTRNLSDLNRGMDIVMQDGGASFPISQNGYGTRSWISFLTLSAFVENQAIKIKIADDEAEQYVMLTMEEPEAHLHPQAQRQLFSQMQTFSGQKVISTHSPSVVAQSKLTDYIYFGKHQGTTYAVPYMNKNDTGVQDEKIAREVINTRAELLFSSAIILCEGITEELALPVYFNRYFDCSPFALGVNIIGIGGQNYKTYLSLIKDFEIPWFIFGDGEDDPIKSVKVAINDVFNMDYKTMNNIIIIEDGDDYEKHLIRAGYAGTIIKAICKYENDDNFFDSFISRMNGQKAKGGTVRNYDLVGGREQALKDFFSQSKNKSGYALPTAQEIVENSHHGNPMPPLIVQLFELLAKKLGVVVTAHTEE